MDEQKAHLDIKKHGGGMMILVTVLMRSRNYGRSGWKQGNSSKEKYLEVLPSEDRITQHKPLVFYFKIREKRHQEKICKLHEDSAKSDIRLYINWYRASSQKDTSVEGYWNVLTGALIEALHRSCGWTKGPARHKETWW